MIAKNYIFWPTFQLQNVWCIFNNFYVVSQKATEFGKNNAK